MKSFWKGHFLTLILLIGDVLIFSLIWRESWILRHALNSRFSVPINDFEAYRRALPALLPVWIFVMAFCEHYSHKSKISSLNQMKNIFQAAFWFLVATLAMAAMLKGLNLGRSVILFAVIGNSFYVYASRTMLRKVKQHYVAKGFGLTRVVIMGAGDTGCEVAARIIDHPEVGYELVGFIDQDPAKQGKAFNGVPVIGTGGDLINTLLRHQVEEVFLAIPSLPPSDTFNLVTLCEQAKVDFKLVTNNLLRVITESVKIDDIGEFAVILLRDGHLTSFGTMLKRAMDLAIAIPAGLATLPFVGMIALWIRLDSPGSAFFVQERIGKDGRRFKIFKFRTMYSDTNPYEAAPETPDDPRVTRSGKFLRKTSLDELPQLWNVILGDMSVVGPRPEMPFLVEEYEPWQMRRLDVPQGITGLWQIAGRKKLPLHLNLEYDFYYIRNWSIFFDCAILVKTLRVVLLGSGAF